MGIDFCDEISVPNFRSNFTDTFDSTTFVRHVHNGFDDELKGLSLLLIGLNVRAALDSDSFFGYLNRVAKFSRVRCWCAWLMQGQVIVMLLLVVVLLVSCYLSPQSWNSVTIEYCS